MMHKSVHFAYSRSQQSDTVQQSNSALQGPTSRIREDYFILSERVQHDSVSTVAFKFQAHHLFHILELDVYRRSEEQESSCEKGQGAQALSLGFTAL